MTPFFSCFLVQSSHFSPFSLLAGTTTLDRSWKYYTLQFLVFLAGKRTWPSTHTWGKCVQRCWEIFADCQNEWKIKGKDFFPILVLDNVMRGWDAWSCCSYLAPEHGRYRDSKRTWAAEPTRNMIVLVVFTCSWTRKQNNWVLL